MRYVIYGAGATGGVMGAALSRIGREVVLIARGRHLDAIREHGLTLRTPLETVRTELTAVERSADVEFREGDAVLLTVKTQDAFAALDELRDAAGDGVPVICAQNGVATEREALRRFRNVYGMVVRFPGMLLEPGVVANYEPQGGGEIELGRCPEGVDDVVEQLAADLTSCGFDGQAEPDVMRWKHEKLLINVGSALAGVFGPGADTAAMRERLVAETRAVLVATGIDLPTPEEALRLNRQPRYDWAQIEGAPPFASSLWQGIQRGLRSAETDYINGEVALLGATHGVETPYNRALNLLANRCAREGIEPGTVTTADLEALVAS